MSEPRGHEGGAGEPAPNSQVGCGEQQDTGPANEDEPISLEPIIQEEGASGQEAVHAKPAAGVDQGHQDGRLLLAVGPVMGC